MLGEEQKLVCLQETDKSLNPADQLKTARLQPALFFSPKRGPGGMKEGEKRGRKRCAVIGV